jgi:hypothetical protein
MPCENDGLVERLLECEKKVEDRKDDLETWTDALEELPEIEDAFGVNGKNELHGKTILDVGTDAVKPLYIALKFEPRKIIGISEELRPFASNLEQKSKLLTKTKIRFYNCSLFDDVTLDRILKKEGIETKGFNFVLVSKTLHHLRTAKCVLKERGEEHDCLETEKCCIYGFEEQVIFEKLLGLGKRVIVYETFFPQEKDDDKVRGRGGYFITKEWEKILKSISDKYKVEFITPKRCHLDNKELENMIAKLRQVDCICFYVED